MEGEEGNYVCQRNKYEPTTTCRSCLASSAEVKSIFEADPSVSLAERVWECAAVRISPDDGLPTGFCPSCLAELERAHFFRARCRRSDAALRELKNECDSVDIKNFPLLFENDDSRRGGEPMQSQEIKVEVDIKCEEDDDDGESNRSEDDDADFDETEPESFPCRLCRKSYKSKGSFRNHMKSAHRADGSSPRKERRYKCPECAHTCLTNRALTYHVRTHTGEKPFACDRCDSRFAQPANLAAHKKIHSDATYFTCERCGKQFKHKNKFTRHKLVHASRAAEARFACDVCHKRLGSKDTLAAHLDRHRNVKNHSCETCGSVFVTRTELVNHARSHGVDKRHSCHLCKFRTNYKISLDKHLMRHAGERKYECDACESSFVTFNELTIHKRKHTKEKRYSCALCEFKFSHSNSLKKHMLKAHCIESYKCAVADRRVVK